MSKKETPSKAEVDPAKEIQNREDDDLPFQRTKLRVLGRSLRCLAIFREWDDTDLSDSIEDLSGRIECIWLRAAVSKRPLQAKMQCGSNKHDSTTHFAQCRYSVES